MLNKMMNHLSAKVGAKKKEALSEWNEKVAYCLRHMDLDEYGRDMLHNLMVFCGAIEAKRIEIDNRIVVNTEYALCVQLKEIMGVKRSRLQDIVDVDVRDTLLPRGQWLWRGYRSYVRRTHHGLELRLIAETHGDQQDLGTKMLRMLDALE